MPIVSISGTNGKSTVTRLITHILLRAGRRVGTTTSDGVLVDERMVEPGDWTGPGGAHQILARRDIEVAVLETARGGIVLRGVGYESNDASVLTNVSSDHLDLQGIHTLPELAEVKSTICRITRAGRLGRAQRRRPDSSPRSRVGSGPGSRCSPSMATTSAAVRRHRERGGRAYLVRDGALVEADGAAETDDRRRRRRADHDRRPGPPQRRQRPRRRRRRAWAGGDDRRGARRAVALRARRRTLAGPAQPVPARPPGRHRRLRPQRGGHGGRPRRRRGHRRGGGRSGGADHGDHRHRRRPARRHAPGHRPDRGRARPAGRDQADAQVPARPDRRVGRRRADGRDRGRRRRSRPTSRSTTPRPRRSRPSSTARQGPAPTADDRTLRGSSS